MPFIAYVHAHEPDPPDDRRASWEPNWRVWRWLLAAVVVAYGSARTSGALAALLTMAVFVLICQAAAEAIPKGDGLRAYRQ